MPRRFRIAIVGQSPCEGCSANCCRQIGHEFAVLLDSDEERRRFRAFSIDVSFSDGRQIRSERVIPYRQGKCPFLGADDRCTIYEDRPMNCRRFQCVDDFHRNTTGPKGHGIFLQRNPDILRRLEVMA